MKIGAIWSPITVILVACAHIPSNEPTTSYSPDEIDEQPRLIACGLSHGEAE